jgi:hypothetical protein
MTQTLNASNRSLNGAKETSAREASTGKQAGRQDARIGHVGLHATNPVASAEFYRNVFGMEIVGGSEPDHPLGATVFLSSRPDETSHEIALFANSLTPQSSVLPMVFRKGNQRFSYFSLITTVGTPQCITAQELRVECMFPTDVAKRSAS